MTKHYLYGILAAFIVLISSSAYYFTDDQIRIEKEIKSKVGKQYFKDNFELMEVKEEIVKDELPPIEDTYHKKYFIYNFLPFSKNNEPYIIKVPFHGSPEEDNSIPICAIGEGDKCEFKIDYENAQEIAQEAIKNDEYINEKKDLINELQDENNIENINITVKKDEAKYYWEINKTFETSSCLTIYMQLHIDTESGDIFYTNNKGTIDKCQ